VDDRHYPQTPHRTAITEKRGAGTRTRSKRIRRLPPMNPALGTGYHTKMLLSSILLNPFEKWTRTYYALVHQ
ncbi:hypothetical protein, partial [Dialister invisus]|uniref:hypothetical protein n=1 Tax=Dialister invisus TaxID=218538 RepID=UPI003AB57313